MKLVDDVKQAWKWFSMWAMGLAVAVQGTWEALPPDMKVAIPASFASGVTITLLLLGIGGRIVQQGPRKDG